MTEKEIIEYIVNECQNTRCKYLTKDNECVEDGNCFEVKSYIIISFDNFTPNPENPHYRDCTVMIDVICHTDCWDIGNYRLRPLKIVGYLDAILIVSLAIFLSTIFNSLSRNCVTPTGTIATDKSPSPRDSKSSSVLLSSSPSL